MYHKVDKQAKTKFWVSVLDFERQMLELKDKQVVSLNDYDYENPNHVAITFDGVYENVYKYAFPILKKYGYPYHLFVTSDYVGKDNAFDSIEPLTNFASAEQLETMAKSGATLEWHTKRHLYIDETWSEQEIIAELSVPEEIRKLDPDGFNWFAAAYGAFPKNKLNMIFEKGGFRGGVSVWQGERGNRYMQNRLEVLSNHSFSSGSVFFRDPLKDGLISVIVPTYNVESHIRDFFNSILTQTYKNLEIIIVDDGSTDNSIAIAKEYAERDERIKIIHHEKNMGVAIALRTGYTNATGDFCSTMSPDDTLDMFYFEHLINKYKETKSDVICGRMIATQNNYMFCDGQDFTFYPFAGKLSALFYFYGSLVVRKMIVENDIWNDSMTERHWEDAIIKCKYAYYANHISLASKAVRFYTMRKASLSHAPTETQLEYQKNAERRTAEFMHSVGIDDVRIKIVGGFRLEGGWDINAFYVPPAHITASSDRSHKKYLIISFSLLLVLIMTLFMILH